MEAKIRTLLLDDHPLILDGLAAFLGAQDDVDVVGRFTTVEEARAGLAAAAPDVAIVDIKLHGGLTFTFVAEACLARPDLKLIFITGHDDDIFIERAFEVGALGFVLKADPPEALLAALRAVMRGERFISRALLERFPELARGGVAVSSSRLAQLTPREREVLKHVSTGKSAKEISRILKISTWTVTNHKANIMAKLDIHNQVGLTRFAVATGLASV